VHHGSSVTADERNHTDTLDFSERRLLDAAADGDPDALDLVGAVAFLVGSFGLSDALRALGDTDPAAARASVVRNLGGGAVLRHRRGVPAGLDPRRPGPRAAAPGGDLLRATAPPVIEVAP
jgi:hypothetical protein